MISDDQLKRILSICEWHDELNRAYAVSEKLLEQMATELLQYREAERINLQCWIRDDPEIGCFDASGIADEIADNLLDDDETTVEVMCSVSLPNRHMRVWLTGGHDRKMNYEWVEKP